MKLIQLIDGAHNEELEEDEAIKATEQLEQFLLSSTWLRTTTLPIGILGSGNVDLSAKAECLFQSLKLDTSSEPRLHL